MAKNFERELPEGYKETLVIDATNKKLGIIFNLIAAAVTLAAVLIAYFVIKPDFTKFDLLHLFLFVVVMFGYIVLHEIVHGIAYKALTGEKLKFGLTLSVAYCGVPDIYVYRKAALISLLAPFVTFTVIFGVLTFVLPTSLDKFCFAFMLGMHVGGCCGDLYDTFLYLFKFKSPTVLMRDTGPKQTFYVKE